VVTVLVLAIVVVVTIAVWVWLAPVVDELAVRRWEQARSKRVELEARRRIHHLTTAAFSEMLRAARSSHHSSDQDQT